MSWLITDDPVRDAQAADDDFQRWLKTRPICEWCGEPIQEDCALELEDGYMCAQCMSDRIKIIPEREVI